MFSSYLTNAQVGGKYAYQFLNLTTSPRMAALGGKNITNYDYDPTQALVNPATINPSMDNHLSVNYVNYIGDVNYGSAAYAYLWDKHSHIFDVLSVRQVRDIITRHVSVVANSYM